MKKLLFISFLILACNPGYLKEGWRSSDFNLNRTYWVAPLPFLVRGPEVTPDKFTRDRAYDHLCMQLQKTNRLNMKDKFTIQRVVDELAPSRTTGIDPSTACKIGLKLGADLVVLTDLLLEPEAGKLPVLVSLQIIDVKTSAVWYRGRARWANPASYEAAAEVAIDNALETLTESAR